jgi:hypothetical protein
MPTSGASRLLKSTRGTAVASGTWLRPPPSLGMASGALSGKLVRMFHRSASGNRAIPVRLSLMVGGFVPDAVGGGADFCRGSCRGGALSAKIVVVTRRRLCKGRWATRRS